MPHFRRAFLSAPNADFFAVPDVAAVAKPLKSAGYGHPRLLAAARPPVVASAAEIDRAQAGMVVRLAEIHCSLVNFGQGAAGGSSADEESPRPLKDWSGELLHRFVENGRPSLEHLRSFPDDHARCDFAELVAADVHATSRTQDSSLPCTREPCGPRSTWRRPTRASPGSRARSPRGS